MPPAATSTLASAPPDALLAAEARLLATLPIPVEPGDVQVAALGGLRLHYLTCGAQHGADSGGDQTPLVLLHGRGSAAGLFAPILPQLAARRRVYALDLPGWGLSEKPPFTGASAADALALWVGGVRGMLDALNLARVDIVGHSMGGFTAAGLALAEPERVGRLVLVDPGGVGRRASRLDARLYFRLKPERLNRWLGRRFLAWVSTREGMGRPAADSALFDFQYAVTTQREVIPSGGRAFDRWINLRGAQLTLTDRLDELAMPVLLLWGERDIVTPYANALEAAPRLRDGQFVTFADTGHSPFAERPDDFARILLDWLDDEAIPARV